MVKNLRYMIDPGHGWLSVARTDLWELNIQDKITSFSYQKGKRVYLEEDKDAVTYLDAAKKAGWDVNIKESYSDKKSWIRYTKPFKI